MIMGLFSIVWLILIIYPSILQTHDDDFGGESFVYVPSYTPPIPPSESYFVETFQSEEEFNKNWIKSSAKKEHTDNKIALYDGEWQLEEPLDPVIKGDTGLVLKSKAKHHAISSKLHHPFVFDGKSLVVQFEVKLQKGLDCGGAYIKLLNYSESLDLKEFTDRTSYVIMFGPDKCGNDMKLHFIFRHRNPLTGKYEEKHGPKASLLSLHDVFKDKLTHLYTLVIHPDNSFLTMIDNIIITSGSLLYDVDPPVNPSKEIVDVNDFKPSDWDDRLTIPDTNAVKPESWDELAPELIPDPTAPLPDGWLVDEDEWIPDSRAIRPSDWDDETDGVWEPSLILNPVCETALGCGPWTPPLIKNPKFKGPWHPPIVNNPNYQGPWTPRMIPNPDYYYDPHPYNMSSIGAVGLELWSMQPDIYFDNFIISSNVKDTEMWAKQTWKHKHDLEVAKVKRDKYQICDQKVEKMIHAFLSQCGDHPQCGQFNDIQTNVVESIILAANDNPWWWVVIILTIALVTLIFIIFCCQPPVKHSENDVTKKNGRKNVDASNKFPSPTVTSQPKTPRDSLGQGQVRMRPTAVKSPAN